MMKLTKQLKLVLMQDEETQVRCYCPVPRFMVLMTTLVYSFIHWPTTPPKFQKALISMTNNSDTKHSAETKDFFLMFLLPSRLLKFKWIWPNNLSMGFHQRNLRRRQPFCFSHIRQSTEI
jgi:hypothetical protein